MSDIQVILDIIKQAQGASGTLGVLGAASVAVYGLVKVFRLGVVQQLLGMLSPKLLWANWPKWACMLFVFGLTLIGSFLGALATGVAWLPALFGGLVAALTAMGADAAVGAVVPKQPPAPIQPLPDSKPNP